MPIALPKPIADYFAADAHARSTVAGCFTPDAVVVDEGRTHVGRDAIAAWKTESSTKYDYVSEPTAIAEEEGAFIVTSHVTGNFPGSPVDLRYRFTLEDGAVARLEIVA